jgi:hypothetical protein
MFYQIFNLVNQKKRASKWELNRVYQDKWATRFSWFEAICGKDGKMKMIMFSLLLPALL